MTLAETFHTATVLAQKNYGAMEVLIMDQGTEFGADFQHLCQTREILPVVTDLEKPWRNSVVERHGALFKMARLRRVGSVMKGYWIGTHPVWDFS